MYLLYLPAHMHSSFLVPDLHCHEFLTLNVNTSNMCSCTSIMTGDYK